MSDKIMINNIQESDEFLKSYFKFHDSEIQTIEIRFDGQVVGSASMTIIKVHGPSVNEYLQGTRKIEFVPGRLANRTLHIKFADVKGFTFSSGFLPERPEFKKGTIWIIGSTWDFPVDDDIKWEFDLIADDAKNPHPMIIFGSAEVIELENGGSKHDSHD